MFSHNSRAIHPYERMGFVAEGVRRGAFLRDGASIDSVGMALLI